MLKHHNEIQEKLAEDMVQLARSMKENATVANKLVKEDTKVREVVQSQVKYVFIGCLVKSFITIFLMYTVIK